MRRHDKNHHINLSLIVGKSRGDGFSQNLFFVGIDRYRMISSLDKILENLIAIFILIIGCSNHCIHKIFINHNKGSEMVNDER